MAEPYQRNGGAAAETHAEGFPGRRRDCKSCRARLLRGALGPLVMRYLDGSCGKGIDRALGIGRAAGSGACWNFGGCQFPVACVIAHGLSITPTVSFPFRSAATITGAITSTITFAITSTCVG